MRVRAFAKINRSLRVVGVRADGYHELRTVFQSIALHDTLTIRERRGPFRLTCDDPDCPADDTNLVWRAAALAWRAAGRRGAPRGVSVHIEKRIPLQAGLGGGSSDGAAALRAFGTLWRIDRAALPPLAATLGADVPYFLEGGTMLGVDRGDRLSRLSDARRAWVVLVVPSFGVSTKDAFGWWDADGVQERPRSAGRSPKGFAQRDRGNDLQPVVARRHPAIAQIVTTLKKAGATEAAMSGSGSAVFGLFGRQNAALDAAAAALAHRARALVTRTLDRAAYQRLAR
jgi:4-diphosphocytidyl-2-C-methyl-D-erythritol kinase